MITFYTAGKVWHNEKFQALRSKGFPVKARWIDLDNESDFVLNQKDELWKQCFEDVRDSDFVLLYCEDDSEEQRGALVEIGMAFGFDKPVYAVGACKTIKPNKISDVAFTHYERFHWLPTNDLTKGAMMAMEIERKKAQMIAELGLEVA
jgi:nucleoside 2-deoxyribosyltransferase|tara:strand:+ start:231 stop:677 length:447 start_codon:yes stop_codon:yes gene_type:complete